jgi:hypothetical protein
MIKKTDWHFRLANFGSKRIWSGDKLDFCTYSRYVMHGFFHVITIFVVVALLALWSISSIYEFYMWCVHNRPMSDFGIMFISVFGSVVIGTGLGYLIHKYLERTKDTRAEKRRAKRQMVKEPGFFGMLYRKFKDKTCFMIKVEDL